MEILLLILFCILMNTSFTSDSVHICSYHLSEINFCNQASFPTLSFYSMQVASRTPCLCCAIVSVDRTLGLEGLKGLESSAVSLLLPFTPQSWIIFTVFQDMYVWDPWGNLTTSVGSLFQYGDFFFFFFSSLRAGTRSYALWQHQPQLKPGA